MTPTTFDALLFIVDNPGAYFRDVCSAIERGAGSTHRYVSDLTRRKLIDSKYLSTPRPGANPLRYTATDKGYAVAHHWRQIAALTSPEGRGNE